MRDDAISLSEFTAPMRNLITEFATATSSALVQPVDRPPRATWPARHARAWSTANRARTLATSSSGRTWPTRWRRGRHTRPCRLHRGLAMDAPITTGVDVVAAGRRNNPPEPGAPALCAFSPLHYLELPELLMGVHLLDDRQVSVDDGRAARER